MSDAKIRAALACLPLKCRYHGDPAPPDYAPEREACCDTGVPARRRQIAEIELDLLARIFEQRQKMRAE